VSTDGVAGPIISLLNQLKSTVPGLVGQIKGWLTVQRYHMTTIFVNHHSWLSFVYLQKSDTAKETLMAKQAFEGYSRTMGVKVLHYHANNGRFCENVFMKDVTEQGQTISFCGVNTHIQSGVTERLIQELQDGARTSLIHAKHRWGSAIDAQLWPYTLRHRNDFFYLMQKEGHKLGTLETLLIVSTTKYKRATIIQNGSPWPSPSFILNPPLVMLALSRSCWTWKWRTYLPSSTFTMTTS
jgi:hypothetical protein